MIGHANIGTAVPYLHRVDAAVHRLWNRYRIPSAGRVRGLDALSFPLDWRGDGNRLWPLRPRSAAPPFMDLPSAPELHLHIFGYILLYRVLL